MVACLERHIRGDDEEVTILVPMEIFPITAIKASSDNSVAVLARRDFFRSTITIKSSSILKSKTRFLSKRTADKTKVTHLSFRPSTNR